MIASVEIEAFKRFSKIKFEFAPLCVLTGLNGAGKTSLIQAILLAQEASVCRSGSLRLNGPFGLELGSAEDVLNRDSGGPIVIRVENVDGEIAEWKFEAPSEDAMYLEVSDKPSAPFAAFSGLPRMFTYLSAERLGPRAIAETSALSDAEIEVGRNGEFCAHVLSVLGGQILEDGRKPHPLADVDTPQLLKYEVEHWLSEITRPIEINGERMKGSTVAELRYRSPGSTWVRSTNMGFGLTYALPIVLAGLISTKGGVIIVENPEAHLHPAGQSRMGVFLSWLAGQGVQVLIETHSDHIINGIRRGIAEHLYLSPDSAAIHYFGGAASDEAEVEISTLRVGPGGVISDWPEGFFDQYQIDVASLGRVRRKKS